MSPPRPLSLFPSPIASIVAAAVAEEPFEQPLKYKTWVLKISIHCQGCKTKVKKDPPSINGVCIINNDPKLHKVIVTGNVDMETHIKKLLKIGKPAQMWLEKLSGKEKKKTQQGQEQRQREWPKKWRKLQQW